MWCASSIFQQSELSFQYFSPSPAIEFISPPRIVSLVCPARPWRCRMFYTLCCHPASLAPPCSAMNFRETATSWNWKKIFRLRYSSWEVQCDVQVRYFNNPNHLFNIFQQTLQPNFSPQRIVSLVCPARPWRCGVFHTLCPTNLQQTHFIGTLLTH